MRLPILPGVAALALAAALPFAPAKADVCCEVGGVAITHGGGNANLARGPLGYAGQSVTTVGGSAGPYGHSLTSGRQPACAGEVVAIRWPASEPAPNARLTPIATVVCESWQPKPGLAGAPNP